MSDHELRLLEDADRMRRKQAGDDLDEDESGDGQDIILAQDLDDAWEHKFQNFQKAPRVIGQCRQECCREHEGSYCVQNSAAELPGVRY